MNKYQKGKARAIELAKEYQNSFAEGKSYYWSEIFEIQNNLERRARRYGLLEELRNEGII